MEERNITISLVQAKNSGNKQLQELALQVIDELTSDFRCIKTFACKVQL